MIETTLFRWFILRACGKVNHHLLPFSQFFPQPFTTRSGEGFSRCTSRFEPRFIHNKVEQVTQPDIKYTHFPSRIVTYVPSYLPKMDMFKSFWGLPPPSYTAIPTYDQSSHQYDISFARMSQESAIIDTPKEEQLSLPQESLSLLQKRERLERVGFIVWLTLRVVFSVTMFIVAAFIHEPDPRLVHHFTGLATFCALSAFTDLYSDALDKHFDWQIDWKFWRPVLNRFLFIAINITTFVYNYNMQTLCCRN